MKRLAVFVSGGGSNFQAIIDGIKSGEINAEVALCISSQKSAYALQRAEENSIPHFVFSRAEYPSDEEMFLKIIKLIKENNIDLIILAGYMTIIPPFFVRAFTGRIINIHPSLLPKYSGKGYYGIRVHEAVIQAGETVSGATVHFVDEGVDTGAHILKREVPVLTGDTPETLQKRILQTEHILIKEAVALLCNA